MPAHDDGRTEGRDGVAPDRPLLTPAQEAAVRARLAEARHTDPVPDHVLARLDAVLADLVADRAGTEAGAPAVVPLAPRRRRALPSGLASGLVAAAAVVALGVALPQVLDPRAGSDGAMSGSGVEDSSAGSGSGTESEVGGSAAGSAPGDLDGEPGATSGGRSGSTFAATPALRSDQPLRATLRPLLRGGGAAYAGSPGCVPEVGSGDLVDATWDGLPAVVVLRPAAGGRRVVEVYVCGSDEIVGTTTLPVR